MRRAGALLVAGTILALPALGQGATPDVAAETLTIAPTVFNHTHEVLIYVALGLGGVNTLLLLLLNRSARSAADEAAGDTADGAHGSSSRTDKRMDKRKREIDELRQQVDDLTEQVTTEADKRLTPAQIQELVRTLVRDELTRTALPGSSPSR